MFQPLQNFARTIILPAALVGMYFFPRVAVADAWNFPLALDDSNTKIRFEVDSTWHLVEGHTSGVNGKLWLETPSDSASVRGEITVPVSRFDTDSSRRDSQMREVMDAAGYPDVRFVLASADVGCSPESLEKETSPCPVTLLGELTVRGKVRAWKVTGTLKAVDGRYQMLGESSLRWPDFGVEDPSIIVARLDPEVKIFIEVNWKKN